MNREEKLLEKLEKMKQYENQLFERGSFFIAGVDEVGRGPLAGPVVAAAVVLPKDFQTLGIDDSKKLSEKKREELFELIKIHATSYGIGRIENNRIDEINILEATKEAMKLAIEDVKGQMDHILIDAITLKDLKIPQTAIIKGDEKSVSIAAASILAKVTRDRIMVEYSKIYPEYSFDKNKGYGTKAHYEGIDKAGICPIHRKSFLKKILMG